MPEFPQPKTIISQKDFPILIQPSLIPFVYLSFSEKSWEKQYLSLGNFVYHCKLMIGKVCNQKMLHSHNPQLQLSSIVEDSAMISH